MTEPKMMTFEDIRVGDQVREPGEGEWVTVAATDSARRVIIWGDQPRELRGGFSVEAGEQIPCIRATAAVPPC
jgi:hypothetical protein